MKISTLAKFIGLTLGVALSVFAVSFVTYADWSQPPSTPPTCPSGSPGCDAPIHVGSGEQIKSGPLGIISVFRTNSASYFAVNSGNVGIGTDSPGSKLHVDGVATIGSSNIVPSPTLPSILRLSAVGTAGQQRVYMELQGVYANDSTNENGGAFIKFRTSTSANYGPEIGGIRRAGGAGDLLIKTGLNNPQERLRILDNGNIGIGTSAPGSKLDVRGETRIYDSGGNLVLVVE